MGIPYAAATSGHNARNEITRILRRFGCEEIGFMDNFEEHEMLLAFKHRGRAVQLKASAKGWAQLYLKENPWTPNRRSTRVDYEQNVLRQGHIAVPPTTQYHDGLMALSFYAASEVCSSWNCALSIESASAVVEV